MSLQQFIDDENRLASFFKKPQIDIAKIDDAQAQEMFSRLDSNMSPECLFADGERPRAAAARLAKVYRKAFEELKAKGFTPTVTLYNL
jgi:hypothetical protein